VVLLETCAFEKDFSEGITNQVSIHVDYDSEVKYITVLPLKLGPYGVDVPK